MKITIKTQNTNESFTLELNPNIKLKELKSICQEKTGLQPEDILLYHNEQLMKNDDKSLNHYKIQNYDYIIIKPNDRSKREHKEIDQMRINNIPSTSKTINEKVERIKNKNIKDNIGTENDDNIKKTSENNHGKTKHKNDETENTTNGNINSKQNVNEININDVQLLSNQNKTHKTKEENTATTSNKIKDMNDPANKNVEQVNQLNSIPPGVDSSIWSDPNYVKQLLLENPDQLSLLNQNNPRLAAALNTGNPELFSNVLKEQLEVKEQRRKHIAQLYNSHPYDVEAQRLIAEEIRKMNIDDNMEAALEYNPETFGTVIMLYINCKVNGVPVKAFVDCGAQTTIMSSACAERCNIMRLLDPRWAGIAKGVGTQRIIGRIHLVDILIADAHLTTSLSILENQPMDMLLGLDILKRHQCKIDLKNNVLKIGTTKTRAPFLSEAELPECARSVYNMSSDGENNI